MDARATITAVAVGLTVLGVTILHSRRRAATDPARSRFTGETATVAAYASLVLAAGLALFIWCRPPDDNSSPVAGVQQMSSGGHDDRSIAKDPPDPDALLRQQIVGVWTDNYRGKRTMTLHHDGTGTIHVELTGATAALFAERLQFDLTWRVDQGRLIKECIGGQPAEKVKLILATMGSRADETVLELTESRLKTSDSADSTMYDWQRVR